MKSLQNATNHVDQRTQHQMNLMGDSYCSVVGRKILETVCEDHDEEILNLKNGVDSLFTGPMAGATFRSRRSMAQREGINGFTILPDNVGIVRPCTLNLNNTFDLAPSI